MKYFIITLCLGFSFIANAQSININENTYKVEGERIFKEGKDVTETLSEEKRQEIKKDFEKRILEDKENVKEEKAFKKSEKARKKEEKKRKKAERDLKQKLKAQSNYDKAKNKLNRAANKYERLKTKGKLSPVGDSKWQNKIEKLNYKLNKAERKLSYN